MAWRGQERGYFRHLLLRHCRGAPFGASSSTSLANSSAALRAAALPSAASPLGVALRSSPRRRARRRRSWRRGARRQPRRRRRREAWGEPPPCPVLLRASTEPRRVRAGCVGASSRSSCAKSSAALRAAARRSAEARRAARSAAAASSAVGARRDSLPAPAEWRGAAGSRRAFPSSCALLKAPASGGVPGRRAAANLANPFIHRRAQIASSRAAAATRCTAALGSAN